MTSKGTTEEFKQTYGFSREFLERTRTLFEPLAGKKLSDEECADIARSVINAELYLRSLKKKYETH